MFLQLIVLVASVACVLEKANAFDLVGLTFTRDIVKPDILPMPPYPPFTRRPPIPVPPPKTESVPLTSISVHATVRAWAYDVTAELNYLNKLNQPIECQFVFPIADNAAVYKLEATIADRKLRAEVRNKTEAEDIYRTAVDAGQKAVLLESQTGSPDVYRLLLGNLPANGTAVVKISYAQPMERDSETGTLSINLPVVLNPRYVPRSDLESPDALKGNYFPNVPCVAVSDVHYTMKFSAQVDMGVGGGQIKSIQSGNASDILESVYANGNRTATVRLTSNFSQDHDFRLLMNVTQQLQPTVYVEAKMGDAADDSGAKSWLSYDVAAAWFEPTADQPAIRISSDEYWLVIDRSGSMSGDKIQNAKTALALLIKSLPLGCLFNIIGFGSLYTPLFDNSVEYSETSVETAVKYANELEADFGGTEILEPFKYIYAKSAPKAGSRRFIILLTDGEVSNTNDVINIARQNAATTRVFSVGIGEGASTALVNGVARVSNGVSEFVRDRNDRLQTKVIGILKATTLPSAENVSLSWPVNGAKLSMVMPNSSALPTAAFRGRAIMQYAVFDRQGGNLDGTATLTASFGGTTISQRIPFTISSQSFSEVDDPMPLHRLAAKARLVELTDAIHSIGSNDALKKEAIAISIATGVLCELTAIIAVDSETGQRANDSSGKPLFVNIERPTIYNMNTMFNTFKLGMPAPPPMPMAPSSFSMGMRGPAAPAMGAGRGSYGSPVLASFNGSPIMSRLPAMQPSRQQPMAGTAFEARKEDRNGFGSSGPVSNFDSLVQLQKFAGSWPLNDEFVEAVGAPNITSVATLKTAAKRAVLATAPSADDETLATFVGLAVLRRRFANRKADWQFIEAKALSYLSQPARNIGTNDVDSLVTAVGTALNL